MISKRLLAIANYLKKNDKVIDVGCDHGYLGIYLNQNNLVDDILLTDINKNALNNAISNIKKNQLNIDTLLTDGLKDVSLNNFNTITISGMGETTIKSILNVLKNDKNIKKIIIQSNNDLDKLRIDMNELGYFLEDETTLKEEGIFYVIGKYIKSPKKNTDKNVLLFGINKEDKKEYYEFLLDKYLDIDNKVPDNHFEEKQKLQEKISILKELLKESR